MPIQTSLGQIRTMAEDLDTAAKGPPVSATPSTPAPKTEIPSSPAPQRPSLPEIPGQPLDTGELVPPMQPRAETVPEPGKIPTYRPMAPKPSEPEDLEKLLPLEEERIEGLKNHDASQAPEDRMEEEKKQISEPTKPMIDLESEIFPKPIQEEKTPALDIPEETPEQILGMEEPSFPAAPSPAPDLTPPEFPVEPEQEMAPPAPPEPLPGDSFTPPTSVPRAPEGGFAQHPKKMIPNTALIIGALIILGAVIAGGAAFLIFSGEETEEPPQQEPLPEPEEPGEIPISAPAAILTPDFIQELSVGDTLESTLEGVLKSIEGEGDSYPQSSITYLPIRLTGSAQADDQFLTAQTFMGGLNMALPEGFFDVVKPTFMLFLFGSEDGERIGCQNNLVSEASCYGPRLGLIFEAQEGREAQITAMMEQWMSLQSPQNNIDALILTDLVEIPEPVVFESVDYQSQAVLNAPAIKINYANLPMPSYDGLALSSTSLDFAIQGNNILFSTSKRSMEIIIDRLLQE